MPHRCAASNSTIAPTSSAIARISRTGCGKRLRLLPIVISFGRSDPRQLGRASDVDRVAIGIDRRRSDLKTIEPGAAGQVMGDVAADAGWRDDDAVAGLCRRHEGVHVGDRARRNADFGIACAEDLGGELRGDDLDLLDALQAHLVLVARIAERGARAETRGERRLGLGVHDVGGRVEVDAVGLVDGPVESNGAVDCHRNGIACLASDAGGQFCAKSSQCAGTQDLRARATIDISE